MTLYRKNKLEIWLFIQDLSNFKSYTFMQRNHKTYKSEFDNSQFELFYNE